jgi:hypothetical protein
MAPGRPSGVWARSARVDRALQPWRLEKFSPGGQGFRAHHKSLKKIIKDHKFKQY